jgi:hypothetical protein
MKDRIARRDLEFMGRRRFLGAPVRGGACCAAATNRFDAELLAWAREIGAECWTGTSQAGRAACAALRKDEFFEGLKMAALMSWALTVHRCAAPSPALPHGP